MFSSEYFKWDSSTLVKLINGHDITKIRCGFWNSPIYFYQIFLLSVQHMVSKLDLANYFEQENV